MSSSTCCGGSCGCGSGCKCQTSCGGCKMNADVGYSETTTISGFATNKSCHEGSEMGAAPSENDGCKCGANCTCNPCTCK
ncbi:metallothionein-like protein type 2 [Cynara cardunculus var. scolymus]|uniref:metallothionein-like protein type 2 n=1 Tax=Cynara cardunculus var. scolymus TaxID=59895 RepID=UPI000D628882|nr:metallothionein-like protein type 2 [Cynara cardunculus var. scolymus]